MKWLVILAASVVWAAAALSMAVCLIPGRRSSGPIGRQHAEFVWGSDRLWAASVCGVVLAATSLVIILAIKSSTDRGSS